ncbi:MAG: glycoside hydrolase family 88 protein, partial [Prevotella sp.]|nr:glycoside hydrolase family 88 protein [Prevotella sp.]
MRYSQWVTKSRMTNFYRNTTQDGFAVYNENGTKTADGHTAFDYVPGLVAKAIVENVEYYSQFDWAQSWAEPFFYNMAGYCNAYYNSVPTGGGSLDNLNASKMFFGIYNLTKTGGAYASKSIASTTNSHAQTALGKAVTGFGAHNSGYKIGTSTPAYEAGHTIVEGGWWHKETYKDEMWLDGSYMGPALFAQLRNYNGSNIIGDDWTIAYRQIQALWEMCWNPTDKLLYHAFAAKGYTNYSNTWAGFNPDGGVFHSASYWGRAVGWYFLALVDILEQMQIAGLSGTANYTTLQSHLTELAAGLAARQDAETGCWYQLLDENGTFHTSTYNNGNNASSHVDTYNYIESSATALFTAGYLKAIRLGYLPSDTYETIAKKGYAGLVNNFFATDGNEGVHLFGSCRSAGLGGAAVNANKWRDGSKAYYLLGHDVTRVKKSDRQTEGKILGAFILAATEYERLYQNNTVLFEKDLAPTYDLEAGDEITCPASGSGADITYQWYKDGEEVDGATNATIAPTASGSYYCKATSGTTTIQSSTANVTVSGETPAETTYTVTFDATTNGGTCATASLTQASSGASITLPTATKSGYTFNGWYTASTGGTLKGAANASYTPTANETLYAQFTENSGTGGEGDCTIKIGNSNVNSYAATFTSSSTNASVTASATAFTVGSSIGTSNSTYSSATAPYSVKYKPSGNINTSEYSDNYSISAQFTVASGYTFTPNAISATIVTQATGYTYQAILTDGTTTYTSNDVASSENGVSTFSFPSLSGTPLSGTVTFKIRFKSTANNSKYFVVNLPITISGEVASSSTPTPTTYTVSYNMNGHGSAIADVTGATALPSTLPTPEATGYTFGGWYTNEGLTSAAVAGASISDNTTLYAKWTEEIPTTSYTVKFYNGETQFGNAQTIEEGATVSAPATNPTKEGYTFKG